MVLRSISLVLLIIWISGCASTTLSRRGSAEELKIRTFAEIYRQSKQGEKTTDGEAPALTLDAPLGVVKPYTPVIYPPRVIKVWVPSHILSQNRDIMVGGHWAFVMLERSRWFIEAEGR